MIFTHIKHVELPETANTKEGFTVFMITDGKVPFAQIILRHADGWEWLIKNDCVHEVGKNRYRFDIPTEAYHAGTAYLQVEGCRQADITKATPEDWIKYYCELHIEQIEDEEEAVEENNVETTVATVTETVETEEKDNEAVSAKKEEKSAPIVSVELGESDEPVIYFGIHKHMHQPYYNATDVDYWDGEKDDIFASRQGPYTHFIPTAAWQYIHGGLPHAGLSTSWSGSLIEQLNRCEQTGNGRGVFNNWRAELRNIAQEKTAFGNPRVDFTAFGFFHPLMPLIPERDIVGQIEWHKRIIKENFDTEASDVLFPPETAFQAHMIPALKQAGINAVIYDSIHHFRACKDYPYGGKNEGMLPPNVADQENEAVDDWLQLHNIWAASKISPQLLKPCTLRYTDSKGKHHDIIGVPAERYLGNEDARGGYGALQYETVMGQIYDHIVKTKTFDPKHPPFFLLHSDGDNHGGGAESYYSSNTGRLVEMCQHDRRFQLITIKDYLQKFPVDPDNIVHVEAGSWAGADNGDPQFTKWFSRAEQDYSPDLNSWAVLTAFQNVVHTLEDVEEKQSVVDELKRLLYTAETSCYWYWTGQDVWDAQVTNAANKGMALAQNAIDKVVKSKKDKTPPTIFMPWVRPANPGGQDWGNNGLIYAVPEATFKTFVHDISGIKRVTLRYKKIGAKWRQKKMAYGKGYPSQINPSIIADQYMATLPKGSGNIRYYIEAEDNQGNMSRSAVGHIFIA